MATATPDVGPRPAANKWIPVRIALVWVLLPLFFLISGGSLVWWEAWVYCALLLVPMTFFVARLARTDPDFSRDA